MKRQRPPPTVARLSAPPKVARLSAPLKVARLRTAAVLGGGAMGSALLRELPKAGLRVVEQWTRSSKKPLPKAFDADAVFLAVSDAAVEPLCAALRLNSGQIVVHLAGALPLQVLDSALEQGARTGSLHPLRAITKVAITKVAITKVGTGKVAGGKPSNVRERADDFRGATAGVAGSDAVARAQLTNLAKRLGMRPLPIRDESRALYHAAAVLAAGAQNPRFSRRQSAPFRKRRRRPSLRRAQRLPLALGALNKLYEMPAAKALTGPAARGDVRTIEAHRAVLPKDLLKLYDELTRVALRLKPR